MPSVKRNAALLALAVLALATFAVLADRALVAQAVGTAAAEAEEKTRLTALAVRSALDSVEKAVLEGRASADVLVERIAFPPDLRVPARLPRPYGARSREELIELLSSRGSTLNGLPEAVVAAIALSDERAAAAQRAGVADRLLSGLLPVRPEDVSALAAALRVETDPRVSVLVERLRAAPRRSSLPESPSS